MSGIQEIKNDFDRLTAENECLKAEIELIKSSNTLKNESVRRLMDVNLSLRTEIERLKADNDTLKAKHNVKRATITSVSYIDKVIRIENEQLNRLIDHLKSQIVNESFD